MDLIDVCQTYFQLGDQHDGRRGGEGLLMNLKLQVKKTWNGQPEITWAVTDPAEQFQGPARKVNVENKTGSADVFSNVKTTKENEMVTKVILQSGNLKGFNRKMRLPLPPVLQSSLGDKVDIDPSKEVSETRDKMTIETISGHDIPQGAQAQAATATISCKQGQYQGCFRCAVVLTGTVQSKRNDGSADQQTIAQIVRDVAPPGTTYNIDTNEVYWEMTGYCDLMWDFEQTVTWEPIKPINM